ncbi:MAG: bacillithiol biosynthesis BshC, partial [Chitinophagaceae bacterium]|nr:bacillithiol biosynthesis BshC [Chitinophagaceae bacterium]
TASAIVQKSIDTLQKSSYKVQAQPREINLFYLKDNFRERIIFNDENFHVLNTDWHFTKEDMLEEIKNHPERFSPNVIIRGIYQERILPNIAFIGGGGELAYWLQLKSLFENYQIPFPVLVVRNSFLMIEKSIKMMLAKLEIPSTDVFIGENLLMKQIVEKDANTTTNLTAEIERVQEIYKDIQAKAIKTDATLAQHVAALK